MKQQEIIYTADPQMTEEVGARLAKRMQEDPSLPPFVALYGDLGVGKTAFAEGESVITGAEAINKSYPEFFNDFNKLGGKANVL